MKRACRVLSSIAIAALVMTPALARIVSAQGAGQPGVKYGQQQNDDQNASSDPSRTRDDDSSAQQGSNDSDNDDSDRDQNQDQDDRNDSNSSQEQDRE